MKNGYILDACTLIAYINDEDGASVLDDLLIKASDGDVSLSMSIVNILEVYYGVYRDFGNIKADEVLDEILSLPLNILNEIDITTLKEAGRIKATYKVSIADSIALGIASISKMSIVTADHHEMDLIDKKEPIEFLWIR